MFGIKKLKNDIWSLTCGVSALRCENETLKREIEMMREAAAEDFDLLSGALSLKADKVVKPAVKKPVKKAKVKT